MTFVGTYGLCELLDSICLRLMLIIAENKMFSVVQILNIFLGKTV